MRDLRFILGVPVEVENVGVLHPLSVYEYFQNINLFGILQITTNLYLQQIDKKDKETRKHIEESIKDFDLIIGDENNLVVFIKLIEVCFKEDISSENIIFDNDTIKIMLKNGCIDRNNFNYVKGQIIKMYGIRLPKQAKTKELQKWFDKEYKAKNGDSDQDLEDIITTIMTIIGYTPEQISKLTIYQINALMARINKVKEFDTNVKYLCAGAEKVKLEPYTAHINLFEEDKIGRKFSDFKSQMDGVLNCK